MGDSLQNISNYQLKKLASYGNPEHVQIMSEIFRDYNEENPFVSKKERKQAVCEEFVERVGLEPRKALQIYNVIENILYPSFGEVSSMVQAQINHLVQEASKNLYQDVYSKEGQVVGEKFDPNVMNAITKAHSVLTANAAKAEDLILTAQKQDMDRKYNEDRLNLQIADKVELKNAIKQGLIQIPDLVKPSAEVIALGHQISPSLTNILTQLKTIDTCSKGD